MPLQLGTKGENMNLLIKQGSDFGPFAATMKNPDLTPVDLTGCVIRAQVRKGAQDTTITASFVVTITDAVNGKYSFKIPHVTTAAIACGVDENAAASQYVWDMEFEDSAGTVIPLYYGVASVFREVTR